MTDPHRSRPKSNAALLATLLLTLASSGCARGCSGLREPARATASAPPARPGTAAPAPELPVEPAPQALPDRLEAHLGFQLPRRTYDAVLPGLSTFPRRRVATLEADRELLIVADAKGLHALGHTLSTDRLDDEKALDAFYVALVADWEKRAGVPAGRALLAIDRRLPSMTAAVLHRVALRRKWRLYVLAREGADLYELATRGRR